MIPVVADAERGEDAETLLPFQAPPLILRRVRPSWPSRSGRWKKIGVDCLNLGQRLASFEAIHEKVVGRFGILKKIAGFLVESKVISGDGKKVVEWWVVCIVGPRVAVNGVIKNADAAAHHRAVSSTERLPGEAESRGPDHGVKARKALPFIDRDGLIVGLRGVMADGLERSGEPGKAALFAHGIGLMFRPQRERQRQVRARAPLILAVESDFIETEPIGSPARDKSLA
jgi:hypothetical protein